MEITMTNSCEIYAKLYKNMKMGVSSVTELLGKTQDGEFKTALTKQLMGYEGFAAKCKERLSDMGEQAKDETPFTKFWASMGIKMNTMIDSTESHIAQMVIEGSTMGVTDTMKILNEYKSNGECSDAIAVAESIVKFEQNNIEIMKQYL